MPYNIKEQPTLTFVARQHGEAWNRPFVSVYEPSTKKEKLLFPHGTALRFHYNDFLNPLIV